MTTLTNNEIVAQFYWNLRAIKEAAGVTPRCWRPPYGDVDDRVRAIAHQMGMSTIIWDSDSFDWGLLLLLMISLALILKTLWMASLSSWIF
uniref:Polysacc_deac_1 n=1 Tax=uncultured Rhizopus TaxID=644539 RepID=A0A060C731_9FUNG|nr:Polysacc_deac_1 [uncultured Rhizopus]